MLEVNAWHPGAVTRTTEAAAAVQPSRKRLTAEIWIVLGLSLGQSAVYAAVSLTAKLTSGRPLAQQTATLNASRSEREYLDLTLQILSIGFALVPVALALFLLSGRGASALRMIGLDRSRPWRDLRVGVGLAAVIGLPGIGVYLLGRELGLTTTVVPSGLNDYWWTVPILVLSAVQNAVVEEVIAVGYLMTRLRELSWSGPASIAASAALRGSYHLYQGVGMALGNVVMGVLFAWWFRRTGRVLPLVVAHTLLDVVSFVGYALLKDALGLP